MKKLISIIIPTHNEKANVRLIYTAVAEEFSCLENYDYEIIFVDDGSTDDTMLEIASLAEKDVKVRFLQFSRNFGKEAATTAGLRNSRGDAAIMIDADMQHPPKLIPELVKKWAEGAEVVVGVRRKNQKAGLIKRGCSKIFYRLINAMAESVVTPFATDFRLLDRVVIDEVNQLTERYRMTRALIDWLGFKRAYVHFEADERANGEASYGLFKLIRLAINSMVSLSLIPLKLAGYLGITIILISGPLGLFIFIEKYILKDPWGFSFSGPAILAVIILFLVGIILSCLGLMALYIASIHAEVINRPLYVIRSRK
jgi:dolichol-phosphate mannosyltransferase